MASFNEPELEQAIIEFLTNEGYIYKNGAEIHKEISDVVLFYDLKNYLRKEYGMYGITPFEVDCAVAQLTAHGGEALYQSNVEMLSRITNGFDLKREDASKAAIHIEPIDFLYPENNVFRFVNQLQIKGTELRIPDGIIYVNGLPLVVLEFKSAIKEDTTIANAFEQLTVRYRRDIPELFRYNAFVVISDGVNSKYGSLFASYEFFNSWRKVNADDPVAEGISSLYTIIKGMLSPKRLLSIVKDYIFLPDTSSNEEKIICQYQQYFASEKLFENIKLHSRMQKDGDGKGGTYFGATGCGKSYTMLFLAHRLMRSRDFRSPTIVMITDRTDLHDQLAEKFCKAKNYINDANILEVESRRKLRSYLTESSSGGVYLTTIQKFSEDANLLSERSNIICISDEAHRSQVNLQEKVTRTEEGVRRNYGFAKYLHDSLPNATFVGFTGTPIDATIEVFGDIVDTYSMVQSVADDVTRPLSYHGRAAKVMLDNAQIKAIEQYYEDCEKEGANEYQIEASKKAVTQMECIIGNPERLQAVAEDFVDYYEQRVNEGSTVEGKAMFVCSNRRIAYDFYKRVVALRPLWVVKPQVVGMQTVQGEKQVAQQMAAEEEPDYDGKKTIPLEKVKLIMTRNKDDEKALYDMLGTEKDRKKYALQFKKVDSNFKIAIVVDMWITGFDVPSLDTIYIDKPLHKHTLIQTISRVNRKYEGKECGLIVDYIGIKNNINMAMKQYASGDSPEMCLQTVNNSVIIVKDELDILRRMFGKFDYSKFTTGTPLEQLQCLDLGTEYIQTTKEMENQFMGHTRKMKSAFNLCSNSEEISEKEREDIHFFTGVRAIIFKLTIGEKPDAEKMNRNVSKMIANAIQSEGVEDIIKISNDKENFDLLSEQYMERLSKLELPNTKVKLMERLLNMVISDFKKVNKVKGVDFTKRLNALVMRYNDRSDSAVFADEVLTEVANQMAELLKEIQKEKKSFKDLGITYEEKAFFDILKSVAKQFAFDYPKDKMLALATEIKKIVDDKSKYTDWSARDDIKAELKMDLILILAEYGYPPVTCDEVFKEIFEQAENFKKYSE